MQVGDRPLRKGARGKKLATIINVGGRQISTVSRLVSAGNDPQRIAINRIVRVIEQAESYDQTGIAIAEKLYDFVPLQVLNTHMAAAACMFLARYREVNPPGSPNATFTDENITEILRAAGIASQLIENEEAYLELKQTLFRYIDAIYANITK